MVHLSVYLQLAVFNGLGRQNNQIIIQISYTVVKFNYSKMAF